MHPSLALRNACLVSMVKRQFKEDAASVITVRQVDTRPLRMVTVHYASEENIQRRRTRQLRVPSVSRVSSQKRVPRLARTALQVNMRQRQAPRFALTVPRAVLPANRRRVHACLVQAVKPQRLARRYAATAWEVPTRQPSLEPVSNAHQVTSQELRQVSVLHALRVILPRIRAQAHVDVAKPARTLTPQPLRSANRVTPVHSKAKLGNPPATNARWTRMHQILKPLLASHAARWVKGSRLPSRAVQSVYMFLLAVLQGLG